MTSLKKGSRFNKTFKSVSDVRYSHTEGYGRFSKIYRSGCRVLSPRAVTVHHEEFGT